MRSIAALLIALLALASPASAFGQSSGQSELEKAQGHFSTGAEYYASGQYSKAIVEFISGHNIAPNAMFLYNISLCYQRLDNLPDARDAAVKARQFEGMTDEIKVRNEARVASFGSVMLAQSVAVDVNAKPDAVVSDESDSAGDAESSSFGALGWSGAAIAAIGVAGLGFSLILNNQVANDKEALEEAKARNDFDEAERLTEEVNSTRQTGLIILFTGIGLTTIGLSMVLWDLLDDPSESSSASLAPLIMTDGAGVSIGGTF